MYLSPLFPHRIVGSASKPSSERASQMNHYLYQAIAFAALFFLLIPSANAEEESLGKLNITVDTTLSHGASFRMEDRDAELVDSDPNGDDGNLNYDKGMISHTSKITTDLQFSGESGGVFGRFTAFTDHFNSDRQRERTALSPGST